MSAGTPSRRPVRAPRRDAVAGRARGARAAALEHARPGQEDILPDRAPGITRAAARTGARRSRTPRRRHRCAGIHAPDGAARRDRRRRQPGAALSTPASLRRRQPARRASAGARFSCEDGSEPTCEDGSTPTVAAGATGARLVAPRRRRPPNRRAKTALRQAFCGSFTCDDRREAGCERNGRRRGCQRRLGRRRERTARRLTPAQRPAGSQLGRSTARAGQRPHSSRPRATSHERYSVIDSA